MWTGEGWIGDHDKAQLYHIVRDANRVEKALEDGIGTVPMDSRRYWRPKHESGVHLTTDAERHNSLGIPLKVVVPTEHLWVDVLAEQPPLHEFMRHNDDIREGVYDEFGHVATQDDDDDDISYDVAEGWVTTPIENYKPAYDMLKDDLYEILLSLFTTEPIPPEQVSEYNDL